MEIVKKEGNYTLSINEVEYTITYKTESSFVDAPKGRIINVSNTITTFINNVYIPDLSIIDFYDLHFVLNHHKEYVTIYLTKYFEDYVRIVKEKEII